MDLTKIDKPFGELDDATKGALLLAAHRGEVIEFNDFGGFSAAATPAWSSITIYRVRHKPVIGEVVFYGAKRVSAHVLCHNWFTLCELTFTFPTRDGLHVPGVYTSPDGLQIKIEVAG